MKRFHVRKSGISLLAAAILSLSAMDRGSACTGIDFSIPDHKNLGGGFPFAGRTMEFGPDVVDWKLLYMPRGYEYRSCRIAGLFDACAAVDNKEDPAKITMVRGFSWPVRYAYVGFTPMRHIIGPLNYTLTEVTDGINEAGLYCGGFYHMGFEEYSKAPPEPKQKNLSNMDFPSWVLGQFSSVAELRKVLEDENSPEYVQVRQFLVEYPDKKPVASPDVLPQLHFKVVDKTGAAIVIEFVNGKPRIFSSVGVITNNPTYDWQVTNLRNYVTLRSENYESVRLKGNTYSKLSNGTGALGLPGDFTSPSRFVRAMFLLNATLGGDTLHSNEDAILGGFRILNQFDIPEGSVVEPKENSSKPPTMEVTSWTSMADLTNLRYYYHTMRSREVRMIDLKALRKRLPEATKPVTIELPSHEDILDETDKFRKF